MQVKATEIREFVKLSAVKYLTCPSVQVSFMRLSASSVQVPFKYPSASNA